MSIGSKQQKTVKNYYQSYNVPACVLLAPLLADLLQDNSLLLLPAANQLLINRLTLKPGGTISSYSMTTEVLTHLTHATRTCDRLLKPVLGSSNHITEVTQKLKISWYFYNYSSILPPSVINTQTLILTECVCSYQLFCTRIKSGLLSVLSSDKIVHLL